MRFIRNSLGRSLRLHCLLNNFGRLFFPLDCFICFGLLSSFWFGYSFVCFLLWNWSRLWLWVFLLGFLGGFNWLLHFCGWFFNLNDLFRSEMFPLKFLKLPKESRVGSHSASLLSDQLEHLPKRFAVLSNQISSEDSGGPRYSSKATLQRHYQCTRILWLFATASSMKS